MKNKPIAPVEDSQHIHSGSISNPWFRESHHPSRLIAYVRSENSGSAADEQKERLQEYCKVHGYTIVDYYEDIGSAPAMGLKDALDAMAEADGIIAVDLERFVHNHQDPIRELKPFLHNFFGLAHRYLLTIREGINTGTADGQKIALQYFETPKELW